MTQKKINQILEAALWILNPFLIVLAVFFQKIEPGLFFQWLGKFHPLLLHFPVVFGILIIGYVLFFQKQRFSAETEKLVLSVNAFLSSVTAILGLFLAMQNSYEGDLVNVHKWGGVAVALLSWLFVYAVNFRYIKIVAVIFAVVLLGAAHKGAQLTHGINALDFPEKPSSETGNLSPADSAVTFYEFGIAPILEQKCVSCHGPDKTKGDLQLNSPENILKGGKNGNILSAELNKEALLLARIHLPLDDDEHMPPDGKLQLSTPEILILKKWINAGADFKTKAIEMEKTDSLFILANLLKNKENPGKKNVSNLPDLAEFNSNYCSVNSLFAGSDEVEVNFFQGTFYEPENLEKLLKIKENIVFLNLQGMPLTNNDLDIIVQFENLRTLNLNYTGLDFALLEKLNALQKLQTVSIGGINCTETSLDKFLANSKCTVLYIWSEKLNESELKNLVSKYSDKKIVVGNNLQNEIIKLNNPTIEQDSSVIGKSLDVKLKHLLNGADIRYTTDGSEPDSVSSNQYQGPIRITDGLTLKVQAFKRGWKSSDVIQRTFYKSEIHPDTIYLVTSPDAKYRGNGAKTLVDFELGENNRSNGKWLGYNDSDLEFVIGFKNAQTLNSAQINALIDIGPYIFPPVFITVLGSDNGLDFKTLNEVQFQKTSKGARTGATIFKCDLQEPQTFKYFKFKVGNVKKLPDWNEGKGKPGWLFVDELFLN